MDASVSAVVTDLVRKAREFAVAGEFVAQGVVNILWSMATLGFTPEPDFLQAMQTRSCQEIASFESQNVGNTLWAFATLNIRPDGQLLEGLLERAQLRISTFKPQEIGNTVWALATLGIQIPPQLSSGIALRSYECVHGFDLTEPPPKQHRNMQVHIVCWKSSAVLRCNRCRKSNKVNVISVAKVIR